MVYDFTGVKLHMLLQVDFANFYFAYDAASNRYAYTTNQGVFTIGAEKPGEKPVLAVAGSKKLVRFSDSSLMFLSADNQAVVVQSLNKEALPVGPVIELRVGVDLGWPILEQVLSANGKWVVSWRDNAKVITKLDVFSGDGKLINGKPLETVSGAGFISHPAPSLLVITAPSSIHGMKILELGDNPVLKTVETDGEEIYQP